MEKLLQVLECLAEDELFQKHDVEIEQLEKIIIQESAKIFHQEIENGGDKKFCGGYNINERQSTTSNNRDESQSEDEGYRLSEGSSNYNRTSSTEVRRSITETISAKKAVRMSIFTIMEEDDNSVISEHD